MQEIIVYKAVVCTTVFLVVKELVEILGEVQMGKQCAYQMAPSSTCLKCYTKTGHKGVEKQRGKIYNKEAVK